MFAVQPKLDCPHGPSTSPPPSDWSISLPAECSVCGDISENWICLTCREVVCSRYVHSHGVEHFEATAHPLALSLSDLSVWCYECSSYVKMREQWALQEKVYRAKFGEAPPDTIFEISYSPFAPEQEHTAHVDENPMVKRDLEEQGASPAEDASTLRDSVTTTEKISIESAVPPIAIFWNEHCAKHNIRMHPEQPLRVENMLRRLREVYPPSAFRIASPISSESVLRFHHKDLLDDFFHRCDETENLNRRGKSKVSVIDGDTAVMSDTRQAVLCAAGAVVDAIDAIYNGSIKSAFCCVRPPGHHAERGRSMGFCFFNNAAIGAKYAQQVYGVGKVAVIDFDVHHGNGTEEGFRDDPTLFYGSTHEKDNFPGTGSEPRTKGELALDERDRRIVNRYLHAGVGSQEEFRVKWREVIDEMILFRPNLVIISAGFDAHRADPLGNCELDESDYEWATDIVMRACREINEKEPPPVISVLEGGYDIDAIAASALVHVAALSRGVKSASDDDSLISKMGDLRL